MRSKDVNAQLWRLRMAVASMLGCVLAVATLSYASLPEQGMSKCERRMNSERSVEGVHILDGPPPIAVLRNLGVLRRASSDRDHIPEAALKDLGFSEVWSSGIRLLGTVRAWNLRLFLVPGVIRNAYQACRSGSPDARSNLGTPLVSLDIYEPSGRRVGSVAYTEGDILSGRILRVYPVRETAEGNSDAQIVVGVVPDGVASVAVKVGAMPTRTATVRDNFFEVEVPMDALTDTRVTLYSWVITWMDAAERPLRTMTHTLQHWSLTASMDVGNE